MGPAATLTGPNFIIPANMGTQVGGNLFHSFGQFNLLNGETADFTATGSTGAINNIIARVTGGSASSIDGAIKSDITGANLFLLNPAGVMFGPHAQVNVTGAFTTGTPDYVKMADGVGKFSTSLGGNDVLTSAVVSAFGFLTSTPNPVQFSQSNLSFTTGSNVTVIGGDITLDGATLSAPAGNVSFFSARSSGELPFDPAHPSASFGTSTISSFGNVTLQNGSKMAIDSVQGGGKIVIRGGAIVVEGSSHITSKNSGAAVGGGIEVEANTLSFYDNSNILTTAAQSGTAGDIAVTAQTLTIDGSSKPTNNFLLKAGLGSNSNPGVSGTPGNISTSISGNLSLTGGGEIATDTFSSGNAGDITVQALTLSINGSATPGYFTGITSTTYHGATGNGGNVAVTTTDGVSIAGGGEISADTFSSGNAGEVNIQSGTLAIDGSAALAYFTGVSSASNTGATGSGGSVNLTVAKAISITAGGVISTETETSGNGGTVNLQAGSLLIDGASIQGQFTGIASTAGAGSTGEGGNIVVSVAHAMSIVAGGEISADTHSSQKGGDINLHVGSLSIDGSLAPDELTGISSSTESIGHGGDVTVNIDTTLSFTGGAGIEEESFANGNGGVLDVTVGGNLSLTNGGFISGDTFSNGTGGSVTVSAPSILIDASGPEGASAAVETLTGIASDANAHFSANGTGSGGDVFVTAASSLVIVNGGRIAALTETRGDGGNVVVNGPGSVSLSGAGSEISAASSNPTNAGAAGSVTLDVGTLELSALSSVATSAVAADAGSINITADQELSIMSGAGITTSAGANGGNINLQVDHLVYMVDGSITATAGTLQEAGITGSGGDITIDPEFVVLDNSLISANAAAGNGGNITIITSDFLNTDTLITATGSTDGTITISAPNLDLSGSLLGLPAVLVSDENRLRESCARSINHEFSSLIMVGRGGTEFAPGELQPDFGVISFH